MRAITLPAGSETSGFVFPGSQVDILGKVPDADNGDKLVAKVIVEKVLVLAVNTTKEAPRADAGVIPSPTTYTVAVKLDDAERIVAAKERGPLTVVLRRPGE
jgi:Flp pilus assembly protein CpaB